MKTRDWLFCHVIMLVLFLVIPCSSRGADNFDFGLDFTIGSPQGEFRDNVDRNGYGVMFEGIYRPGKMPFGVGLGIGYLNYGSDERTEPLSTTIPDMKVEVDNENNIVSGLMIFRFQQGIGAVSPYFDGLFGLNYLYTSTKIREPIGQEIASSTNFDDWAFTYGIGGGCTIRVYDFENLRQRGDFFRLSLNIRARYMVGGEAEYLKEGSIKRNGGKVSYDVSRSETDLLLTQIGLGLRF